MKFIHTSDWHIGQTLHNFDREDEHRFFLRQLSGILKREQPDALLISGDVYNTPLPSIQSQELMVEALVRLHADCPDMRIIIIAGNHDSAARLEIHSRLWHAHGIHIVGRLAEDNAVIPLPDGKGTVIAMPYMNRVQFTDPEVQSSTAEKQQSLIAGLIDRAAVHPGPVVLMAHLSIGGGEVTDIIGGIESRPLSAIPGGYDYLALGHIHLPVRLSDRARYCGSPLPMTFDEDYPHYVNLVEIHSRGELPVIEKIEIAPLRSMLTVEADSTNLAIEKLSEIAADVAAYVRVVIDTPDLLPADIDDRARVALAGKNCRFCGCSRKVRESAGARPAADTEMEVDEFRRLPPLEVARRYFDDEGVENAPVLLDMLRQVIDNLNLSEEQ